MQITPLMVENATSLIDAMRNTSAVYARYDRTANRVSITLESGVEIGLLPRLVKGLHGASPDALTVIEIGKDGRSIYWPRLGVDLFVPGLLLGEFTPLASGCIRLDAAEAIVRAQFRTQLS